MLLRWVAIRVLYPVLNPQRPVDQMAGVEQAKEKFVAGDLLQVSSKALLNLADGFVYMVSHRQGLLAWEPNG